MSMRVTDSYMSRLMVRDMHRSLSQMLRYQQMASSMSRITRYADDPTAIGAINRYRSLMAANDQYLRNTDRSRVIVEATDSAMLDVSEILSEVREIVMRESSATSTRASQDQSAEDMQSLIDRMLNSLNVTVQGNYIFGGHITNRAPFVQSEDSIYYQGDSNAVIAQVGPDTRLEVTIPGSEFLGSNNAVLGGLLTMSPRLTVGTSLDDLNLGAGWEAGQIVVTDGTNQTYSINLTGAADLGDVITRINTDSSGALTAGISANGQALVINGIGPLTVTSGGEGETARSLGLEGRSESGTMVGLDIREAPTPATLLADIPELNGDLPLGELVIETGGVETTVDFSAATTIGDLQTMLNTALPGFELRIDGAVFGVVSSSAESFTVRNGEGFSTATDLGISGTGSPARLFGVLTDLKEALESHDGDRINGVLTELGEVQQLILKQVIKVGGKETTLDWVDSLLRDRNERLMENLSQEKDADMAVIATELTKSENAYQATLMVTSRLFQDNLMQYLR
ncbi:MAG: flagellar hook-associated protein FlgL [bacterium]